MTEKRLEGKVALITGASQGIGEAIALLFAQKGAFVVVSDIQDHKGSKVAQKCGGGALYIHLDVREESEWVQCMHQIEKHFGRLNILVNNAGISGFEKTHTLQDPENATLANWKAVHAVNSDGVFLGCKHAIGLMKKTTNGSIINISSRSGLVGIPSNAAYASSKASVRNHTKSVALYCCQKGYNIRSNSIHPAVIFTEMWEPMLGNDGERESRKDAIVQNIPMLKSGTPEDVANAALFLASDESSYITGIELPVDGGLLAGMTNTPQKIEEKIKV